MKAISTEKGNKSKLKTGQQLNLLPKLVAYSNAVTERKGNKATSFYVYRGKLRKKYIDYTLKHAYLRIHAHARCLIALLKSEVEMHG